MPLRGWAQDVADLVLGRACLLCEAPGPSLCRLCLGVLRTPGRVREALLDDLPRTRLVYALPYRGSGATLVLSYKEHGFRCLARPLGLLLADAVAEAMAVDPTTSRARSMRSVHGSTPPVTLIPVPSHRRPARGFDALRPLVHIASRDLQERGLPTRVVPALRESRGHQSLKRLGRRGRRAAVHGSMVVDERLLAFLPAGPIVVVDDVVTTGSTVREALRALRCTGARVHAVAAVAHQEGPGA